MVLCIMHMTSQFVLSAIMFSFLGVFKQVMYHWNLQIKCFPMIYCFIRTYLGEMITL